MLVKPLVQVGQMPQAIGNGDVLAMGETILATTVTQPETVTGAMLLNSLRYRSPAAPSADPLDTAANIIAAIKNAINGPVPDGLTWRHRVVMLTANAITYSATANTGVTVDALAGNQAVVAASSFKDFLCQVTCGADAQSIALTSVNGSAVLTAPVGTLQSQSPPSGLALLRPGMIVTNAQAGQQGNTILAVNLAAGTVTMSGNSTSTNAGAGLAFNFSPTFRFTGITGIV